MGGKYRNIEVSDTNMFIIHILYFRTACQSHISEIPFCVRGFAALFSGYVICDLLRVANNSHVWKCVRFMNHFYTISLYIAEFLANANEIALLMHRVMNIFLAFMLPGIGATERM